MARAIAYSKAIRWIAENDDCDWVWDKDPIPSVTAVFVCDIYGKSTDEVHEDIRNELEKIKEETS